MGIEEEPIAEREQGALASFRMATPGGSGTGPVPASVPSLDQSSVVMLKPPSSWKNTRSPATVGS
jgi:hypothetical protein